MTQYYGFCFFVWSADLEGWISCCELSASPSAESKLLTLLRSISVVIFLTRAFWKLEGVSSFRATLVCVFQARGGQEGMAKVTLISDAPAHPAVLARSGADGPPCSLFLP